MALAIRTEGLSKRFGARTAVDGIDFQVAEGEIFGFLGPNGAGKTTTIRMLLGLARPTSGLAWLLGATVPKELGQVSGRVGSLLENPSFYPTMSARENLRALALTARNRIALGRIDPLLERLGLGDRADDRVGSYSKGMLQRLGLAAALVLDPELLLLDEPVSGLDPAGIREVRDLLLELRGTGKTIFLSSHLLSEVEQVCDSVAVINRGRIVQQGSLDSMVTTKPAVRVVVEEIERATTTLRERGWKVSQVGPSLVVEGAAAADVNEALGRVELHPSELRQERRSLEEIFLELTRAESEKAEPGSTDGTN